MTWWLRLRHLRGVAHRCSMKKIAVTLLLALLPLTANAAIAIDATSNTAQVTATSVTLSISPAAGATILLIGGRTQHHTYTTMTYNGASTTQLMPEQGNAVDVNVSSDLFGIVNPTSAAHNMVFSQTANDTITIQGVSYTGTDATLPTNTVGGSISGTSYTTTLSGNKTGAWNVVWFIVNGGGLTAGKNDIARGTGASLGLMDSNGIATSTWGMSASDIGTSYVQAQDVEIDIPSTAAAAIDSNFFIVF